MQHRKRPDSQEPNTEALDLPQGFVDENPMKVKVEGRQKPRRKRKKGMEEDSGNWMVTFALLMIIVFVASYFLVVEHEKVQMKRFEQKVLHDQVEPISRDWEEKYAKLQEENERLLKEANDYDFMKKENERMMENQDHQAKLRQNEEKQIAYYKEYQKKIQERIKLMSHALVLEK